MVSFSARRANHDLRSTLGLWAEIAAACHQMTPDGYDRRYEPNSPALNVLQPVKIRTAVLTNEALASLTLSGSPIDQE